MKEERSARKQQKREKKKQLKQYTAAQKRAAKEYRHSVQAEKLQMKQERQNMVQGQPRRKRPGSFVLKITFKQMLRMILLVFVIDVVVVALCGALMLANAERTVHKIWEAQSTITFEQYTPLAPDIEVRYQQSRPDQYWMLPSSNLSSRMGFAEGALREVQGNPFDFFPPNHWSECIYTVFLPADAGGYLAIAFNLGPVLYGMSWMFTVLLCFEGVWLFFSIWGIRGSVRKTLAPIQQLTIAAQSISSGTIQRGHGMPQQELELAGTINTLNAITAKRLDTRIPIDEERQEMMGLAAAINNMLDRLDAAYQSQLRFVSDASHELRTPIAVIQGYANLLDRWGKEDPEALQESIDAIKAETDGMQALVEQLLFLARSDNDSIMMELEELDVSALAAEVLRDTKVIDTGHDLVADIKPGLRTQGDTGLLKQAMRIFVDNAIKYTPAEERITLAVKRDGDQIRVSVTDNGIGIPEEDLPHVFERFYRSDESRARKTGGTGLGLAIAKWTVQRHGGYVEITSRKDIGTRITMFLPILQDEGVQLVL